MLLLPLTACDSVVFQTQTLAAQVGRSSRTCPQFAYAFRQSVVHKSQAELTAALSMAWPAVQARRRSKGARIRYGEALLVVQFAVRCAPASAGSCERIGLLHMQFKALGSHADRV